MHVLLLKKRAAVYFAALSQPETLRGARHKPESYHQPLFLVLNCYVMTARSSYFLLTTHLIKCFTKRLNKTCWTWGLFQPQLCSTCSLSATPPLFWTGCRNNGGVFNLHTVVFIFTRRKHRPFHRVQKCWTFPHWLLCTMSKISSRAGHGLIWPHGRAASVFCFPQHLPTFPTHFLHWESETWELWTMAGVHHLLCAAVH